MSEGAVVVVCIFITAAIQLCGFFVAFWLQTEKFYDILGGLNFLTLAAYTAFAKQPGGAAWNKDPRKTTFTAIFACSRGWLLLFLAWRAHERQGDARFDGVKDKFGKFLVFWIVQGVWVFIISLPMLVVNTSSVVQPDFSTRDTFFLGGFALGVALEVVADIQKAAWVREGRIGGFCKSGLWAFSRHPNYFGEMLQWWCAWSFAYASSSGFTDALWMLSILSPIFTMHILLNIPATGVMQANGKSLKRYYDAYPQEYALYRDSTSILIPMIGYKYVPMSLKRTIFLDLARYEYRPQDKQGLSEPLKS